MHVITSGRWCLREAEKLLQLVTGEKMIEARASGHQRGPSFAALQDLLQGVDLVLRKSLREKTSGEVARRAGSEELLEQLIEPRPTFGAVDHHAGDRLAQHPLVEADLPRRAGDVDGLGGGNRETVAPESEEEIVQDLEHGSARTGPGQGPVSASRRTNRRSISSSRRGSKPTETSLTTPRLSMMNTVGNARTPNARWVAYDGSVAMAAYFMPNLTAPCEASATGSSVMPMTDKPCAPNLACQVLSLGAAIRQATHHTAQKSRRTTRPLSACIPSGSDPATVAIRCQEGAGAPTLSSRSISSLSGSSASVALTASSTPPRVSESRTLLPGTWVATSRITSSGWKAAFSSTCTMMSPSRTPAAHAGEERTVCRTRTPRSSPRAGSSSTPSHGRAF